MPVPKESFFEEMSAIDVSPHLFEKNGRKYLPWSKALELLKLHASDAVVYECSFDTQCILSATLSRTKDSEAFENHVVKKEMPFFTDGRTCMVKTRLVIPSKGIDEYCTLPVMDNKNQCIPADRVTMADVNKTLRRCATKNIAMATGLGLSLWHKEEISEYAEAQKIIEKLDRVNAIDKFKQKIEEGFDRLKLVEWLKTNFGTTNPMTIKSQKVLDRLNEELDKLDIKDFQPDKKKENK